jgi:hypothetical protein
MAALAHLAGAVVECGTVLRQRCEWCGAALIDQDLALVQVAVPDPLPEGWSARYPTWAVGAWVEVDGAMTSLLAVEDGMVSPPNSCMRLDPAVTG